MDVGARTQVPDERKRGPIPCMQCIERASALGSTSCGPSLCHRCTALLRARNGPKRPASDQNQLLLGSSFPLLQPQNSANAVGTDSRPKPRSVASSGPPKETNQGIVEKIKAYSYEFVNAVNDRDFDRPIWSRTASDLYMSDFDCYAPTTNIAGNIRTFQLIAANDPTYHIKVRNIDVIFDSSKRSVKRAKSAKGPRGWNRNNTQRLEEDGGEAVEDVEVVHAYANQLITGRPAGVMFECVAVFTYMQKAGDWVLVAFNAMRFAGPSIEPWMG